jgi:hypothetical protein
MDRQPRVALHHLHAECSAPLGQILWKLLSLNNTQQALAQIVEGIPTENNYFGPPDSTWYKRNPDIAAHIKPSDEVWSLALKYCSNLDLKTVNINATTARLS